MDKGKIFIFLKWSELSRGLEMGIGNKDSRERMKSV
jgi:hypothetical protein